MTINQFDRVNEIIISKRECMALKDKQGEELTDLRNLAESKNAEIILLTQGADNLNEQILKLMEINDNCKDINTALENELISTQNSLKWWQRAAIGTAVVLVLKLLI